MFSLGRIELSCDGRLSICLLDVSGRLRILGVAASKET